jgi:hypothetical protein
VVAKFWPFLWCSSVVAKFFLFLHFCRFLHMLSTPPTPCAALRAALQVTGRLAEAFDLPKNVFAQWHARMRGCAAAASAALHQNVLGC